MLLIAQHVLLTVTLLIFSANFAFASSACEELHTVTHALRTAVYADGSRVQNTVTLPDYLGLKERSPSTQLHYRVGVSNCASSNHAALAIFRVGAPYRAQLVALDGRAQQVLPWLPTLGLRDRFFIWWGGSAADYSLNGRAPVAFALAADSQFLDITLTAAAYIPSGLTLLQIGSDKHVGALQARSNQSQLYFSDIVAALSVFLALLAVGLGVQRKNDMGLRWFALGCLCWGPRSLLYLNTTLPGNGAVAELLISLVICYAGLAMLASTLYAYQAASPRLLRGLKWVLAVVTLVFVLALVWPVLAPLARLASFAGAAGVMGIGAEVLRRKQSEVRGVSHRVKLLMVWGIWAQIGTGFFDFGITLGLRPPTAGIVTFWGFTGYVIALAMLSGSRIVDALHRAENTNLELEQRVLEKSAELDLFYQHARSAEISAERNAARDQERERLTREMHDGIGAQLMTALRGVERGAYGKEQVAQSLQDGLDELRLLMDSADVGRSLQGALATWRNRWDARLAAVGLALVWEIDGAIEDVVLPEDTVLQLMRILQEAVTNAVKHANASSITVRAGLHSAALVLEIADNGVGLSAPKNTSNQGALTAPNGIANTANTTQRGLRHIAHRAQAIGAQCVVANRAAPAQGVSVRVSLPLASG